MIHACILGLMSKVIYFEITKQDLQSFLGASSASWRSRGPAAAGADAQLAWPQGVSNCGRKLVGSHLGVYHGSSLSVDARW